MATNKDIARLFAQHVDNASNPSGTLYIKDGVIYSYGPHFIIGRHVGLNTVEITTRKYLATTSKQTGLVAGTCAVMGLTVNRVFIE